MRTFFVAKFIKHLALPNAVGDHPLIDLRAMRQLPCGVTYQLVTCTEVFSEADKICLLSSKLSLLHRLRRIPQAYLPTGEVTVGARTSPKHRKVADADAGADEGVGADPGVIAQLDWGPEELERVVCVVVGAGTEVGVLADDGASADGDSAETIQDCMVTYGGVIPNIKHPGNFDLDRWADGDPATNAGTEAAQQQPAVGVPVVKAEAKERLADDHP